MINSDSPSYILSEGSINKPNDLFVDPLIKPDEPKKLHSPFLTWDEAVELANIRIAIAVERYDILMEKIHRREEMEKAT